MALPETVRRESGWRVSKTALSDEDALNLLKEFAELKRKERENDPEVKRMKNKYKLNKMSAYPSPGNILHTGRQLPRSPGPGVLSLLPSQKFEHPAAIDESFEQFSVMDLDNVVPCGRQLPRTPTVPNPEPCPVLREIQPNIRERGLNASIRKPPRPSGASTICNQSKNRREASAGKAKTLHSQENDDPAAETSAHMKTVAKEVICSVNPVPKTRRISELPVKGLSQVRISGILKKMEGYECRSEDIDFLKHMEMQGKVKALKAELVGLRKNLTATQHDRDLMILKNEKIEEDIQKMKCSYERMVQLGRAFLSRTQDPSCAAPLSPEDVLKQLSLMTIQSVHQQEKARLLVAQKEAGRRRQEVTSAQQHLEDTQSALKSRLQSCEKNIGAAKERNRMLKNEVMALKAEIEKNEEERSKLEQSLHQKREQIKHCMEQSAPPFETEVSEEDRERMNRRLQRILYRKNLYLEREKIIRRLQRQLK